MRKFSAWALLREAFSGQQGWQPQWRRAAPQPEYDAVIVGGGGHGLAAAYYLAAEHRPHARRGRREGLDRRRQHRSQHDDHPLELPVRRERTALRSCAAHVARPVAGPELQRHVLAARRDDARAHRARRAGLQATRARQPLQRRRQRVARADRGEGVLPAAQHRAEHPLPGPGCGTAAPRRDGPARCRRLGLRARRGRARRRHHRELRGHRHPSRRFRRRRSARDVARTDSHAAASESPPPATPASCSAWPACGCRSRASRCRRSSRSP